MIDIADIGTVAQNIHKRYLREAYRYAHIHSQDWKTKVGSLIRYDTMVISYGTNHFKDGIIRTGESKYSNITHAEVDSIEKAQDVAGENLDGYILYAPWFACEKCAEKIVEANIRQVIGHLQIMQKTPAYWEEDVNKGLYLLKDNNVRLGLYDGKIGGCVNMFGGEVWLP